MILHVLDADDGSFIGELIPVEDDMYDFWAISGESTTLQCYDDERMAELQDLVAAELGVGQEDIYLTDEEEGEILYA